MYITLNISVCSLIDIPCLESWRDRWRKVDPPKERLTKQGKMAIQCTHCMPTCSYVKYRSQCSFGYIKNVTNLKSRNKFNMDMYKSIYGITYKLDLKLFFLYPQKQSTPKEYHNSSYLLR